MASAWTVQQQTQCAYRSPNNRTLSKNRVKCPHNPDWRSRVALLVRKALNMSSSSHQSDCSHQSRVLLAAMRTQLAIALEERELTAAHTTTCPSSYSAIVSCNTCGGFMVQPVCMPCGHSVCKACTEKSTMMSGDNLVCPKCNQTFPKVPKAISSSSEWGGEEREASHSEVKSKQHRITTLTLQNAFRKWYPKWVESCQYREEGNKFANDGDFASAIQWYTQALATGVCDFRVLGNRSCSYRAVGELEKACEDAELACRLHPFWAKGHYRRGAVLEKQGCWREAIAAFLLCLHLGGNDQAVLKAACQLLDKNMSLAEKQALSKVIRAESPSSSDDNLRASSPLVLVESEDPPLASSSPPSHHVTSEGSLVTIVEIAVGVMGECLEVAEAMKEEMRALVAPAEPSLVDPIDFECVLCTGLLYDPVTTLCGHSFCRSCLCRSFDHSPTCPICRLVLIEGFQQHCQSMGKIGVDTTLESILLHYFPDAYMEKKALVAAEIQKNLVVGTSEMESLPVFVCTMAYPSLNCPLHIFEPRYRLMVRRCMESGSRRFGMCQPAASQEGSAVSFANFGTILHINSVELMEDGRFLISTQGERRFKVLERNMTDGYHIAKIMFLFDERVTNQEEIVSLRALQQETYDTAKKWLYEAPFFSRIMMMQVVTTPLPDIDPVPECCPNGPEWVWWFVHALPTTPTKKLDFLKCTSLRERLSLLQELLTHPILNS